jgi:hypothetical protein
MDDIYDLFEQLPNGAKRWRGFAEGIEKALAKLGELGKSTPNEVVAINLLARRVAGRVNSPDGRGHEEGQDEAQAGVN